MEFGSLLLFGMLVGMQHALEAGVIDVRRS